MSGEKKLDPMEEIQKCRQRIIELESIEMDRLRARIKFLEKCNEIYRIAAEKIAKNHNFDIVKDPSEIAICSQELSEKTLKETAFLEYDYIQARDGKKDSWK